MMLMNAHVQLVAFRLGGERYALDAPAVERVVRAVELTPLPGAPETIRGVFNLRGRILPVGDLRRRLGLAEREVSARDQIVIARTATRTLGVLTEGETEIVSCAQSDIVCTQTVARGVEAIAGIGRLASGLILIHDLERFLSPDEERALDEAMQHA